jgi:hypothetical protein
MSEAYEEDKHHPFTPINASKAMAIISLGAVAGLIVWVLSVVIDTYILRVVLCHGSQALQCASTTHYAEAIAAVISASVGLFFLVRLQVFRPLLVVLAAVSSLWGIVGQASLLPWYGIGLSTVMLYAFAYILFAWIARIRSFWIVLFLMAVLIIAVRLMLNY